MSKPEIRGAGERQAAHFDEIGDLYLWVRRDLPITRAYYDFWTAELFRRGPNSSTGWAVDGMCGGADVAWSADVGTKWVGIDIALNLLAKTPRHIPRSRVERVCGDITGTPIASGSIDAVYIRGALHHVPDYPGALREILRILRLGGRLIMSEPSDDVALYRWLRNTVYRFSSCFDEETEKAFRRKELTEKLEEAGFRIKEYTPFGYVAYMVLGQTDVLKFFQNLQKLPGAMRLARVLIAVDRLLPRVPLLRRLAFANMVVAEKGFE